ncbi:helix-turn-helix domain-containing protein [Fluviicola chungangensis]|uniref:Helix-turn-helix transcriptional regulator n=1 Tax=Fluviicola chungangensis TaxID=2597671 RepID=A0A556MQ46_9FLAO|nr:AraC family transcriptional regulator [Fluviicola chungangensis]TSJ42071.1 helix-turn-helix transcriptional regulator [Fluviicola chungangensis]
MRLYIKYMISSRCKLVVRNELEKLGIQCVTVDLGIVETLTELSDEELEILRTNLSKSGLELLEDKKRVLVVQMKDAIIDLICNSDEVPNVNYSDYLSEKLGQDYTYLSGIFSEAKGVTVQQFIILKKIERVKELLAMSDMSLAEIAFKLNYSSVAHLSNQFKKNTGLSPSNYREMMADKVE